MMIVGLGLTYLYSILTDYYVYRKINDGLDLDNVKWNFNKAALKKLLITLIPVVNVIYSLYLSVNYMASDKEFLEELYELGILKNIPEVDKVLEDDDEEPASFSEDLEIEKEFENKEVLNEPNLIDYQQVTVVPLSLTRSLKKRQGK